MKTVLVTGSDGFIGRNLIVRLRERAECAVFGIGRSSSDDVLAEAAREADFVFHLAGVNRPVDLEEFVVGNVATTDRLISVLIDADNRAPIAYTSSTQAALDNPYGTSKREAELLLEKYSTDHEVPLHLFRLPNVFGKWARPNYNSAVATFCHNIARGLPIKIDDPAAPLNLVYIDDVIDHFVALLDRGSGGSGGSSSAAVAPTYHTTVGEVAAIIEQFGSSRRTLLVDGVGTGLKRALYATYLSHLDPQDFAYDAPVHGKTDPRGVFVEMLKTPDAGQFSYFIAHRGVTRGEHYHHSKTEKFLVITGTGRFAFRHIVTGETVNLDVVGGAGRIVETVPGWTHNITNVGDDDLICALWANEIFDPNRPDTVAMRVEA